jgi:hypothetical protein
MKTVLWLGLGLSVAFCLLLVGMNGRQAPYDGRLGCVDPNKTLSITQNNNVISFECVQVKF